MSDILRFFLLGLGPGGIYALLAVGVVLVYRGSGVVNFGAGGFALIGAIVYYELQQTDVGTPVAVICAILVAALSGVLVQVLILHPMRAASPLARVVATLGIGAAAELGALAYYGGLSRYVGGFLPLDPVKVGNVVVGADRLYILGITVLLTAFLWTAYRYTRFGIATTAVAENPRATACLAWSPSRIAALNGGIGGALSGVAGVLLVPILGFAPPTFILLIVPALAVAVLAGFRSFPLALFGGLLVGVLEAEGTLVQSDHPGYLFGFIPTFGLSSAVPFIIIIAVLVVRGRGLPLRGDLADRLPRLGTGVPNWPWLVIMFALTTLSLWIFNQSWVAAVSISATVGLVGMSVVVVTGYAGQLSLAQFALAGMGALVSSRLADGGGVTFLLAAVGGVVATILVGLVVALPAVRVRGVNLAVITMGLAAVISSVVLSNTDWNGGAIRGTRVPDPTIFGLNVQSVKNPELWSIVCLVALLVAGLILANLRRGRSARRLIAVRDNERAAASLGVNVFAAKLYAFAVASGLAGMGGVLLAFRNTSVDFSQFAPFKSIEIVLLTVIGAVGFIVGGVFGGIGTLGGVAHEILSNLGSVEGWFRFGLSVLFLGAIVLHPDGAVEFNIRHVFPKIARRFRKLLRRPAAQPAPSRESVAASERPKVVARTVTPRVLEVRDLEVRFGGVVAVGGVSFNVVPGEVFGLIGPNGAGKTTVVDAISGFLPSYKGQILLDGKSIDNVGATRRARAGITRSFQSLELFEDLSVADNLRIPGDDGRLRHLVLDLLRPRRQELSDSASAAVQEFQLEGSLDKEPSELSYAMRRAVAIARSVAAGPSVLLLDEPAAGLDSAARAELERLIRRLAEDWQMAVLLIEHDVSMVLRTCDRVMALEFGLELVTGTPEEVRRNELVVRSYIGETAATRDAAESHENPELSGV